MSESCRLQGLEYNAVAIRTSFPSDLARGRITVLSSHPHGGECIRPLRALDRHIRPPRAQCTHTQVRYNAVPHVSHQKCRFPWGGGSVPPSNTRFLGPTVVSPQTESRSVQPFLQRSPVCPTHRQTHTDTQTQTTLHATSVAIGRIYAMRAVMRP